MNKLTRNLILPAAALAALLLAPASEARDARPRQRARRARARAVRARPRPAPRPSAATGTRRRTARPIRVASGFRFYSVRPGPRYIYVTGFGWALPPYFGAVWVPGHYAFGGVWVDGCWR